MQQICHVCHASRRYYSQGTGSNVPYSGSLCSVSLAAHLDAFRVTMSTLERTTSSAPRLCQSHFSQKRLLWVEPRCHASHHRQNIQLSGGSSTSLGLLIVTTRIGFWVKHQSGLGVWISLAQNLHQGLFGAMGEEDHSASFPNFPLNGRKVQIKMQCKKHYSQLGLGSRAPTDTLSGSAGAWRPLTGSRVRESRGQNGIKAFLDVARPRCLFGFLRQEKNNSVKIT